MQEEVKEQLDHMIDINMTDKKGRSQDCQIRKRQVLYELVPWPQNFGKVKYWCTTATACATIDVPKQQFIIAG